MNLEPRLATFRFVHFLFFTRLIKGCWINNALLSIICWWKMLFKWK